MNRLRKRNKVSQNSKASKVNISLKRRLVLYYVRISLVVKILVVILLLLFMLTGLFGGVKQKIKQTIYEFTADYGFVLENIIIQGQINTSNIDIIKSIDAVKGTPIFALNLDEIKKRLDNSSWVKVSIVERRLPNALYIAINERNPIAIWQSNSKLYLVDEDGERISGKDIEKFPDLLQVVGEEANIYAKSLIDDLAAFPEISQKVKSAVRYGNRRWDLNLEENIVVKMPENDFAKAYEYLNKLHISGKLFGNNLKNLNLRDPDRYYIEKHLIEEKK